MNDFSETDAHDVAQTSTPQKQQSKLDKAVPTVIPDDSETDFDDPKLLNAIDQEIKKSRELLAQKFAALERHLSHATKIATEIRALVMQDELS
jgi:hypothetical protein